jgi:hypothetical protein
MKAVATAAGGLAVLVVSFWLTLKVIDGPQLGGTDFDLAMAADGFTSSDAVIGLVDTIRRDADGRLQLEGWAFDKELAQPVSVFVLVGTKLQQIAVTNGSRPDVTAALHQSSERTKNVTFTGVTAQPLGCGPHTIVGVNQNKRLSIIASNLMVPRCAS